MRNPFLSYVITCFFILNFFFLSSCGLDVYYVMPSPVDYQVYQHQAQYSNTDFAENYFLFNTYESDFDNEGGLQFQGTEVYYKIYSNSSTMLSQVEALQSLASNDSSSTTAINRMTTTYSFQPLKALSYSENTLIPYTGTNRSIKIRLTDYLDMDDFSSKIIIYKEIVPENDNENLEEKIEKILQPVRNVSERSTFNFGRTGVSDKVPKSEDEDVNYTSMSDGNKWYVAMFSVAVGMDILLTPYYSNILYLGSVTIDADSKDN